jgi:hypothetical protein
LRVIREASDERGTPSRGSFNDQASNLGESGERLVIKLRRGERSERQ